MNKIESVRYFSRGIIRELEFFQKTYLDTPATHSESHILIELNRLGNLNVNEIAKILNVDKSTASRCLKAMTDKKWLKINYISDQRKKLFSLTDKGKKVLMNIEQSSNNKIISAFNELTPEQINVVINGLKYYSTALKDARLKKIYKIRKITKKDDPIMAKIVKKSLKDFGFNGPGTAAADQTLDHLSENFLGNKQVYFVVEKEGQVCGGAGIIPLVGADSDTCELIRMFMSHEEQGTGLGNLLIKKCIQVAKEFGFKQCYLETTEKMKTAQNLYLKNGFKYLKERKGDTGHFMCNVCMELELN